MSIFDKLKNSAPPTLEAASVGYGKGTFVFSASVMVKCQFPLLFLSLWDII